MSEAQRPPEPSVSFFLIKLGRRVQTTIDSRLAEHGLSYHHFAALGHLNRDPGLSYSELARRSRVSVQSMQTTIAHLLSAGLVERDPGSSQGRRAELALTDSGRRVLRECEQAIRDVDDELTGTLSASERERLESLLSNVFRASLDAPK